MIRGRALDLLDPKPDDVDLEEVARSLSNQCRFAGCVRQFYSVAEHSVLIARWLRDQGHNDGIVLGGLLHDAAAKYRRVITQPMQEALFLADEWGRVRRRYKLIQARLDAIIAHKAGITPGVLHCDAVKEADLRILLDERAVLLTEPPPRPWAIEAELGLTPLGVEIECWSPVKAGLEFREELDRCLHALSEPK